MSITDSVQRTLATTAAPARKVRLSRRVNEHFPPLEQTLSAHDVARLTRRHRWVLYALTALGRFPKPQRFRGKAIGWHRRDLANWLELQRELDARQHRRSHLRRLGRCRSRRNRLPKQ